MVHELQMGAKRQTFRLFLILSYLVLSMCSLAIGGAGVWLLNQDDRTHEVTLTGALLVGLGALSLVVCVFGCSATWRQKTASLTVYMVLGVLIILVELSICLYLVIKMPTVLSDFADDMGTQFHMSEDTIWLFEVISIVVYVVMVVLQVLTICMTSSVRRSIHKEYGTAYRETDPLLRGSQMRQ